MTQPNEPQTTSTLWSNQTPVVDGIVPVSEVPQDPDLFRADNDDLLMTED